MKNIVDVQWLQEHLSQVVVVDATSDFLDEAQGKIKYHHRHLPGAFHMDLDEDLRGVIGTHGGRHPLPTDMTHFAHKLEKIGISNHSMVVVYDEGSMYAARFWWMCKYIGLENVKVLDGGIAAWINAGHELTTELPQLPTEKGKITVKLQKELLADYEDIRAVLAAKTGQTAIVDSRANDRFRGENETVDPKAGHIPGALNYFFGEVLTEDGAYKDAAALQKHYEAMKEYDELILHCGSGVSGAVNVLALDEIGVPAKFYVGSWSDYITHEDAVVE